MIKEFIEYGELLAKLPYPFFTIVLLLLALFGCIDIMYLTYKFLIHKPDC